MIQRGDGKFKKLYEQGRCPKCRSQMEWTGNTGICKTCNTMHSFIGVDKDANRTQSKDGVADDQ